MDFVPDYEKAQQQSEEYDTNYNVFGTYARAYVITNENLRQLPQLMPRNRENILTVVGSGDHPLWFSLYGAKNIDTFDVSYNAKMIMDIKVAALSCLSWHSYKRLLDDLYESTWYPFVRISGIKNMCKILPKLPSTESEYIKLLGMTKIFRPYCRPKESKTLPTFLEYMKLHIKVKESYNFYMTDIRNLGNCLKKSYDVIHLSNILDYVPTSEHKNVILPLLNHVNPGGRIIAHNMNFDTFKGYFNYFGDTAKEIADSLDNWKYIQKTLAKPGSIMVLSDGTHILERVR